jgi:hypothetical protein
MRNPTSLTANVVSTKTQLTPLDPNAGVAIATSELLLAENLDRKGVIFINLSDNTLSFGLGVDAVLNNGITITGGGVWQMDEYSLFTGDIYVIADVAGPSAVAIQEFV